MTNSSMPPAEEDKKDQENLMMTWTTSIWMLMTTNWMTQN